MTQNGIEMYFDDEKGASDFIIGYVSCPIPIKSFSKTTDIRLRESAPGDCESTHSMTTTCFVHSFYEVYVGNLY
jgi:hypothetical protein